MLHFTTFHNVSRYMKYPQKLVMISLTDKLTTQSHVCTRCKSNTTLDDITFQRHDLRYNESSIGLKFTKFQHNKKRVDFDSFSKYEVTYQPFHKNDSAFLNLSKHSSNRSNSHQDTDYIGIFLSLIFPTKRTNH